MTCCVKKKPDTRDELRIVDPSDVERLTRKRLEEEAQEQRDLAELEKVRRIEAEQKRLSEEKRRLAIEQAGNQPSLSSHDTEEQKPLLANTYVVPAHKHGEASRPWKLAPLVSLCRNISSWKLAPLLFLLCCLALLSLGLLSWMASTGKLQKNPAYRNAETASAGLRDGLVSTMNSVTSAMSMSGKGPENFHSGKGLVAVESPMFAQERGFYAQGDESSGGRYEYISSTHPCKLAYNDDQANWELACNGKTRCTSFYTSVVPPTDGWQCTAGDPPQIDLINSILKTSNSPGEPVAKGSFALVGTRNEMQFYENGETSSQIAYNSRSQAWELYGYLECDDSWETLYCHPGNAEAPVDGWTSSSNLSACHSMGKDPAPTFKVYDVRSHWAGKTEGTWSGNGSEPTEVSPNIGFSGPNVESINGLNAIKTTALTAHEDEVCVRNREEELGCYMRDSSSYTQGRYVYIKDSCVIGYDHYWTIRCDGKETCKNMLDSFFPPTEYWECGQGGAPKIDLGFNILRCKVKGEAQSHLNELIAEGTFFKETGIRDGRPMYESSEGCQISFHIYWAIKCYDEEMHIWFTLYSHEDNGYSPPIHGWTTEGKQFGPVFEMDNQETNEKSGMKGFFERVFI